MSKVKKRFQGLLYRVKAFFVSSKEISGKNFWSQYIHEVCDDAYKGIHEKSLKKHNVKGIIRHLPIAGIDEGHYQSVYVESTKCLIALWQYSIDMGFTGKDKSFIAFLGDDIDLKNVEGWNRASKELEALSDFLEG